MDGVVDPVRIHMEVGANLPLKRVLTKRYGCGLGTTCFLFDPQYVRGAWAQECEKKAKEIGNTTCLPYAAWVRNETREFKSHTENQGQYSTLYSGTIRDKFWTASRHTRKLISAPTVFSVQAIDLAEWMQRHIPTNAYLTAKIDVEGAEYALMRHLIMRGQACRFSKLEFEGHAMSNPAFAPLRAFDVLLPWLLHGCERPPTVAVSRYYGTNRSSGTDLRVQKFVTRIPRSAWCADCALLDELVDTSLGSL